MAASSDLIPDSFTPLTTQERLWYAILVELRALNEALARSATVPAVRPAAAPHDQQKVSAERAAMRAVGNTRR